MIYIDTHETDLPTCPRCGYANKSWGYNVTKGRYDKSEWKSKCAVCMTAYSVKISVRTEFTTDRI